MCLRETTRLGAVDGDAPAPCTVGPGILPQGRSSLSLTRRVCESPRRDGSLVYQLRLLSGRQWAVLWQQVESVVPQILESPARPRPAGILEAREVKPRSPPSLPTAALLWCCPDLRRSLPLEKSLLPVHAS